MTVRHLGIELLAKLDKLIEILDTEPPVVQQQLIELLASRHALRTGDLERADLVIDGMRKHVRQLVGQNYGYSPSARR
jgi:hypothetical protein